MAGPPKTTVQIVDFPGLVLNSDPRDTPPGAAQVQTNVASVALGELQVRRGYRPVSFDE